MVPGDMYKWSGGIFAKKTKFHDAGGPGTVVSPSHSSHARHIDHVESLLYKKQNHLLYKIRQLKEYN